MTRKSDTWPLVWLTAVFCFKVSADLFKKQSLIFSCLTDQPLVWKQSFFWEITNQLILLFRSNSTVCLSIRNLEMFMIKLDMVLDLWVESLQSKSAWKPKEKKTSFVIWFVFEFFLFLSQLRMFSLKSSEIFYPHRNFNWMENDLYSCIYKIYWIFTM